MSEVEFGGELELVFTGDGKAELYEGDDPVWHSDADEDFRDEFADDFLNVEDAQEVLEYLADAGFIEDAEIGDVIVSSEEPDDVIDAEIVETH